MICIPGSRWNSAQSTPQTSIIQDSTFSSFLSSKLPTRWSNLSFSNKRQPYQNFCTYQNYYFVGFKYEARCEIVFVVVQLRGDLLQVRSNPELRIGVLLDGVEVDGN